MNAEFLYSTFEYLHAHPELGLEEHETSAYLADRLEEMGYEVIGAWAAPPA